MIFIINLLNKFSFSLLSFLQKLVVTDNDEEILFNLLTNVDLISLLEL